MIHRVASRVLHLTPTKMSIVVVIRGIIAELPIRTPASLALHRVVTSMMMPNHHQPVTNGAHSECAPVVPSAASQSRLLSFWKMMARPLLLNQHLLLSLQWLRQGSLTYKPLIAKHRRAFNRARLFRPSGAKISPSPSILHSFLTTPLLSIFHKNVILFTLPILSLMSDGL